MAKKAQNQKKENAARKPEFNPNKEQNNRNVDKVWKTYLVRANDVYKKMLAKVPVILISFKDVDEIAHDIIKVKGGVRTILNPDCKRKQAWYLEALNYYALVIEADGVIALIYADMFIKVVEPSRIENIQVVHIQERKSTVRSYGEKKPQMTEVGAFNFAAFNGILSEFTGIPTSAWDEYMAGKTMLTLPGTCKIRSRDGRVIELPGLNVNMEADGIWTVEDSQTVLVCEMKRLNDFNALLDNPSRLLTQVAYPYLLAKHDEVLVKAKSFKAFYFVGFKKEPNKFFLCNIVFNGPCINDAVVENPTLYILD